MKLEEAPNLSEDQTCWDNSYARTIMATPNMLAMIKFNKKVCSKQLGYQTNLNF